MLFKFGGVIIVENLVPGVRKLEYLSASVTHLDRYPYMCYVGTMGKRLFYFGLRRP